MTHFTPCKDRSACTEGGSHCQSCGRSHVEIAQTRTLTSDVARFISAMDYDNPEEFMDYVTRKVLKKVEKINSITEQVHLATNSN